MKKNVFFVFALIALSAMPALAIEPLANGDKMFSIGFTYDYNDWTSNVPGVGNTTEISDYGPKFTVQLPEWGTKLTLAGYQTYIKSEDSYNVFGDVRDSEMSEFGAGSIELSQAIRLPWNFSVGPFVKGKYYFKSFDEDQHFDTAYGAMDIHSKVDNMYSLEVGGMLQWQLNKHFLLFGGGGGQWWKASGGSRVDYEGVEIYRQSGTDRNKDRDFLFGGAQVSLGSFALSGYYKNNRGFGATLDYNF